ncbi:Ribosome production factor 1 [Hondaea fermentalgiana]|uniref:Ribosome production factor 1 n=1 Tax=Hondaea fermentalgiana TaxID=2315210 RepID=A0A2R5GTI3_9STRA|nr:Ribosome production factor 1 [Hondaea fermentalgiana]|eukprot:GBG33058.1 Ribosome production factor 1 [Hondaea fermentalgiana]
MVHVNDIRNKAKRAQIRQKLKVDKEKAKQERKLKRKREAQELGEDAPPKQVPKTQDSTREADNTVVAPDDEEVLADEEQDEFSEYFANLKKPKIMITTRPRPSSSLFKFISDLMLMFPNSFFYPRRTFGLSDIKKWAHNKKFTHLLVLGEKANACNQMLVAHLPIGPTMLFKISNVTHAKDIRGHANKSDHLPEIILNRFQTRLGHRVGRFLGSMFQHEPEFRGRNVVTFHNQRDFIFVRHHRYQFSETGEKAKLHEIGPRFTMKMRWIMADAFDTEHGEYEWVHKRKQEETSRRKFAL